MKKQLRVIELFAGIGSPRKALIRGGYNFEVVDAIEIDKYAVKSYNAIYNENIEAKDICSYNPTKEEIGEIDLLFHGSPCQDFSLAGKQAGGDKDSGTRSSLMYETIRIVEELKPKYVIWENVKNLLSKKHRHNFDAYLETMEQLGYTNYYQVLNAKDYGIPQNRERVFTISILGNENYKFPKGKELEKLPIDLIEENANKKYDLTEKNIKHYQREFGSKGKELNLYEPIPTLTASMGTGGGNIPYFTFPPKQPLKLKLKDMLEDEVDEKYYLSDKMMNYVLDNNETQKGTKWEGRADNDTLNSNIAHTLSVRGTGGCQRAGVSNFILDDYDCEIKVKDVKLKIKEATKLGYKEAYKGDGVNISSRMKYQRGNVQKESIQTITTSGGNERGVVLNNLRIRKLTPKECWRLMGFDDEDFEKAAKVNSNSQLYKQAGNSIVVNVLMAIFKELIK